MITLYLTTFRATHLENFRDQSQTNNSSLGADQMNIRANEHKASRNWRSSGNRNSRTQQYIANMTSMERKMVSSHAMYMTMAAGSQHQQAFLEDRVAAHEALTLEAVQKELAAAREVGQRMS